MDFCSFAPNLTPSRFANRQLVILLAVGIFNKSLFHLFTVSTSVSTVVLNISTLNKVIYLFLFWKCSGLLSIQGSFFFTNRLYTNFKGPGVEIKRNNVIFSRKPPYNCSLIYKTGVRLKFDTIAYEKCYLWLSKNILTSAKIYDKTLFGLKTV